MDAKEFTTALNDLEKRLDRLRALYDQWFQGFERLEPTVPRKEFDRKLDVLRREVPRSTSLRFRYQQIVHRYTMFITYWQRTARQIEEGTFKRDVRRAKKLAGAIERGSMRRRRKSTGSIELDMGAIEFMGGADDESDETPTDVEGLRGSKLPSDAERDLGLPKPPRVPNVRSPSATATNSGHPKASAPPAPAAPAASPARARRNSRSFVLPAAASKANPAPASKAPAGKVSGQANPARPLAPGGLGGKFVIPPAAGKPLGATKQPLLGQKPVAAPSTTSSAGAAKSASTASPATPKADAAQASQTPRRRRQSSLAKLGNLAAPTRQRRNTGPRIPTPKPTKS